VVDFVQGGPPAGQQQQPPQAPNMGAQNPMIGGNPAQAPAMDQMMPPPMGNEGEYGGEDVTDKQASAYIDYALSESNIAKDLKKKKTKDKTLLLEEMGMKVHAGYMRDEESRELWLERLGDWIKLATLVNEGKSFPWPNASNVKYPLVATAAMQFAARSYPALVPSDGNVVKAKVIGYDPDGTKYGKAARISKFMSYYIMHKMPNWEEHMDRLCIINPILGTSFKKTYCKGDVHCSELVLPQNLCINYYARDLESAYRKTEILYYTRNEVVEKVNNNEEFLKEALDYIETTPDPSEGESTKSKGSLQNLIKPSEVDEATPHVFLAQHTFYDLDNDGYEEPYIITIHKDTQKVVRIVARFQSDGIEWNDKKEIVKIQPLEYFTKFGFIPNPDSAIYDLGFGLLLGEINQAVDTLINQLIDSGTINNLPSGFLGKGLRIKQGEVAFRPGEWKMINATGDDMKNSIMPLPTKEPSQVLFNLLGMLVQSGNQLASVAEIMTGKMPGQNTPATTTQETVEQGMKVFTAIYKRLYRSLMKEFRKIYNLCRIYPQTLEEQQSVLDVPLEQSDFEGPQDDIIPGADPSGDSSTIKMMKYQQVLQMLLPLGTINPMMLTQQILEGLDLPAPQGLIVQPQPQQDPAMMKAQADMQAKQVDAQLKAQMEQLKLQNEQMKAQMEQQKQAMELKFSELKNQAELQAMQMKHQQNMRQDMQRIAVQDLKARQAANQQRMVGAQKMQQQDMAHRQKMQQTRESNRVKNNANKRTGTNRKG